MEIARNKFYLWLAKSKDANGASGDYIHGGGFRGGDKGTSRRLFVQQFPVNGMPFASTNYWLSDVGP